MGTIGTYQNWYEAKENENKYKVLADFKTATGNKVRQSKRFENRQKAISFFENCEGFCLLSKTNFQENNSTILKYKFN